MFDLCVTQVCLYGRENLLMIKSMQLTNFQGHKQSQLEFTPGVNVITGESDIGKSSLMRALWWLVGNRPSGAGEKWAWWGMEKGDRVSVTVALDNAIITRFRKGGKNGYQVRGADGGFQEELVAIRTDVPIEVSELLRLEDHNIQSQHQSYFLLSDTPGEVARKLNAVCGLDIIDSCQKNSNLLLSNNSRDLQFQIDNVLELELKLKELDGTDRLEALVVQVEEGNHLCWNLEKEIGVLEIVMQAIDELDKEISELDTFLQWEPVVQKVVDGFEEMERLQNEIEEVEGWLVRLDWLEVNIAGEGDDILDLGNRIAEYVKQLGVCPECGQEVVL